MKALPEPQPEKKKPAIQPSEVWSPSMGGTPMKVYGDLRDATGERRPPRSGWGAPDAERYQQAFEAWVREQQRQHARGSWNQDRAGHVYPLHPDDCGHHSKRFRVAHGWDCLDCGKKLL